jgi:hypothetical protein
LLVVCTLAASAALASQQSAPRKWEIREVQRQGAKLVRVIGRDVTYGLTGGVTTYVETDRGSMRLVSPFRAHGAWPALKPAESAALLKAYPSLLKSTDGYSADRRITVFDRAGKIALRTIRVGYLGADRYQSRAQADAAYKEFEAAARKAEAERAAP